MRLRHSGLVKYARTGGDQYKSVIADLAHARSVPRPELRARSTSLAAHALIAYAERVRDAKGLGVLQFHGTGGDYLEVTAEAHQQLLDWLRKHPEVWVATFQDVLDYVSAHSR